MTVTGPAAAVIVSSDEGALAIAVACSFFIFVYDFLCFPYCAFKVAVLKDGGVGVSMEVDTAVTEEPFVFCLNE